MCVFVRACASDALGSNERVRVEFKEPVAERGAMEVSAVSGELCLLIAQCAAAACGEAGDERVRLFEVARQLSRAGGAGGNGKGPDRCTDQTLRPLPCWSFNNSVCSVAVGRGRNRSNLLRMQTHNSTDKHALVMGLPVAGGGTVATTAYRGVPTPPPRTFQVFVCISEGGSIGGAGSQSGHGM